jgi:glycosyltransferase domain-containing protein
MPRRFFSLRELFTPLCSGGRARPKDAASAPTSSRESGSDGLTVVMPTYNRPEHCAAQLRFLKSCDLRHAVIVADSSDPAPAARVRSACAGIANYRHYGSDIIDKFLSAVRAVDTVFAVLVPDDDVTFPHAIDGALTFLRQHPDYAAAHGYTLQFGMHGQSVDIHRVCTFVPSIDQADPLERVFHLMRRYQPFLWAVFRREVLISALEAARPYAAVPICQELAFMNTAVVQGKVALLPMIYAMRGAEESKTTISAKHPLFACVANAELFFATYAKYRSALVDFIWKRKLVPTDRPFRNPVTGAPNSRMKQFIDVAHGSWLAREANVGVFNHAAEILLGQPKPLLRDDPEWGGWKEPGQGDAVHATASGRKYVWRRSVLEAEPREEISISSDEIARVEAQLEGYQLG